MSDLADRLRGMLKMAVASEDAFNRLSPSGIKLLDDIVGLLEADGLEAMEARADLHACWDALQAETKRADAAEGTPRTRPRPEPKLSEVAKPLAWLCQRGGWDEGFVVLNKGSADRHRLRGWLVTPLFPPSKLKPKSTQLNRSG